jgi:hypothetical protein
MDERSVPVAFLIFNRPQTTQRVFEAIRHARPRRLLVVADGPRANRPGEAARCAQTRAILEKIDWDCDVEKDLSDVNLGCRRRIASGLDWVFSRCEEAIILEDDCLPDPSFFPFCAEMLMRYRDDHRVMAVAGVNFGFGRDRDASYYFSRYIHIWGWASWRRAWKHYDVDMKSWPIIRDGQWLRTMFPDERSFQTWQRVLQDTFDGRIGTWDYQLTYAAFMQRMLGIVPTRNLISNIGFGADATHTAGYVPFAELPLEPMPFPLKHPPFVLRDTGADAGTQDLVYSAPRLIERIGRKVIRICRSFGAKRD